MANKIEIVIEASDKASANIKALGGVLNASGTAASFAATAYDKAAATANRLQLVTLQLATAQKTLASETDPTKQAQLRVEIDNLAKAQDTLQRETQESTTKLIQMGEAHGGIKVLGLSLTDLKSGLSMVMGAAQKAGQALQAAFDYTQRGAAIRQTTESFDRLGLSIDSLREASLGTVDDMTLMRASLTLTAGASETLQQHLLGAAPQLLEIAKAANALNPTLGDTAFMYESISTGIKRNSPLILDNLGIVVKIGEANAAYAAQLGKSVEALTAEEQSIALLNATIEAGDRLIQQAGGSIESYTDAWARLTTEITNTKDALAKQAAQGLGPVFDLLADGIAVTRQATEEFGLMRVVIPLLAGDYGNFMATVLNVNDAVENSAKATGLLGDMSRTAAKGAMYLSDELARERDLLEAMQNPEEITRELISDISETAYDSADAFRDYQSAIDGAHASTQNFDAINAQRQLDNIAKAAELARDQVDLISWGTEQTFTEQLEDGKTKIEELREKAGELQAKIAELEGLRYRTSAQETELSGLRDDLSGVNDDIQDVISSTDEMVKTFILGMVEMQIAADQDITPEESDFYVRLAAQFGLVDDAAIEMRGTVLGVLADVQAGTLSPEQGIKALGDAAAEAQAPLTELGTAGVSALDALGLSADGARNYIANLGKEGPGNLGSVTAAADGTASALGKAAGEASGLKAAIDALEGKEIEIKTVYIEEHRAVGQTGQSAIPQAEGGDYYVNRATHFVAGEAGAERAIFIPRGEPGYDADFSALLSGLAAPLPASSGGGVTVTGDGGTRIGTVNLTVNGTADARETARLVLREFQDRGFIPRIPLR